MDESYDTIRRKIPSSHNSSPVTTTLTSLLDNALAAYSPTMRPFERLRIVNLSALERARRHAPVHRKYTATLELTWPPYRQNYRRDYEILLSSAPRTHQADARRDLARMVRDVSDFMWDVEVEGRRGRDVRWPEVDGRSGEFVEWTLLPQVGE